jgi:hypothetical protein
MEHLNLLMIKEAKLKRLLFNLKPNEGKFKLLKSNDNIMAYSKITIDFVAVHTRNNT